jgi:hypothetical protein
MPPTKLSSLLAKPKTEKETLMGFQKTKNCRDKKKAEKMKSEKKKLDHLRYLARKRDKIGLMEILLSKQEQTIKESEMELRMKLQDIEKEKKAKKKTEAKLAKEKKKMKEARKSLKKT